MCSFRVTFAKTGIRRNRLIKIEKKKQIHTAKSIRRFSFCFLFNFLALTNYILTSNFLVFATGKQVHIYMKKEFAGRRVDNNFF